MMAFDIQELGKTVKKNPVPWAIGAGIAIVGGYIVFRQRSSEGYITEAYPEQAVLPKGMASGEIPAGGAGAGYSDLTSAQLQKLLGELEQDRHEDVSQLAEMNRQLFESLTSVLEQYSRTQVQSVPQQPVQEPVVTQDLLKKAETIYATPTIIFSEKGTKYTPEQVDVMHSWAVEEQAAISRGTQTSKNPVGLAASGMTVTYYPTGHVAFVPRGQEPPPAPKDYAPGPVSQALKKAMSVDTSAALRKVTGKAGTVEQQLAGMSQAEKLSALKKAGLIK